MDAATRQLALDTMQEATVAMRQMNTTLDALLPLCPCRPCACVTTGYCDGDTCTGDGREQGCPIHGDGETFVAYVKSLEALLYAVRGWRTRVTVDHRTPPAAMSTQTIELLRAACALDGV